MRKILVSDGSSYLMKSSKEVMQFNSVDEAKEFLYDYVSEEGVDSYRWRHEDGGSFYTFRT